MIRMRSFRTHRKAKRRAVEDALAAADQQIPSQLDARDRERLAADQKLDAETDRVWQLLQDPEAS